MLKYLGYISTAMLLLSSLGCSQNAETDQPRYVSVVHVSRWINDEGLSLFKIHYDDGSIDLLPMSESEIRIFSRDREYHRDMNPKLWDQAWEETLEKRDSWQSFKDRYTELGGTMLFD